MYDIQDGDVCADPVTTNGANTWTCPTDQQFNTMLAIAVATAIGSIAILILVICVVFRCRETNAAKRDQKQIDVAAYSLFSNERSVLTV